MWLIMTALAAVIATAIWYRYAPKDKYRFGLLALMFWGATIMWTVDSVMAHLTEGEKFFELSANAALLGFSSIVLALVIWGTAMFISGVRTSKKVLES